MPRNCKQFGSRLSEELIINRGASAAQRSTARRLWLAIAAGFCGIVAFGIYSQAAQGGQLDAEVALLHQQNSALQQQISDRQREIVEAQTAAWLEEEARKLGYVLPGEKIFVLTQPGQAAPASGGVSAPLPSFSPVPTPRAKSPVRYSPPMPISDRWRSAAVFHISRLPQAVWRLR